MYTITYERSAEAWLLKLAKRNPDIVAKIVKKIDWLAQNVDHLDHEKMKGHSEMSLHFAGYRILYLIDRLKQSIVVRFIDKHDEAHQKLKRM
jgi:mRNA-degrading endonuclease RelE of RelBE toxin-antitoxin system